MIVVLFVYQTFKTNTKFNWNSTEVIENYVLYCYSNYSMVCTLLLNAAKI